MNVPRGTTDLRFDIVVVGAGHAGCEAALASGRLGMSTALITLQRDRLAAMSCNPAIGGLGKSQIVREIDALGGQMGRAADAAAIHFRRLNASKGPAVRARRVQCDMGLYHRHMLRAVEDCPNIELIEETVERLLTAKRGVCGVELKKGKCLGASAVVVTTGTFLNGLIHIGLESYPGGRLGDPSAVGLSKSLADLGLEMGRLKTGTPARLDASTLDLTGLQKQAPDAKRLAFSHVGACSAPGQVLCHITRTNPKTHAIIRRSLSRSPLYTGVIEGRGPRYCPSIEDKVVRFPDRDGHQVILEPTDLTQQVIYPNGISTSLPCDVQLEMIRSIAGLEEAEIVEFGYAIEYDFVQPTQLRATLETRAIPGLFLAGQINGTSGYEEAAGQGLLAGINAVARVKGVPQVVLPRQEAYIGVMVDDLVTRGVTEPYRMFSSRSEFRLLLREDNAARRLEHWACRIGLAPREQIESTRDTTKKVQELIVKLRQVRFPKDERGRRPTLEKVLKRPGTGMDQLAHLIDVCYPPDVLEQAEVIIKYRGYIDRQIREAQKLKLLGERRIPNHVVYKEIPGLSFELVEKLSAVRPETFAQASQVDGMTPAALMVLSTWLKKITVVPRETAGGGQEEGA